MMNQSQEAELHPTKAYQAVQLVTLIASSVAAVVLLGILVMATLPSDVIGEVQSLHDQLDVITADYQQRLDVIDKKLEREKEGLHEEIFERTEDRFHGRDFQPAFDRAFENKMKETGLDKVIEETK